jgi:hypothetical protein
MGLFVRLDVNWVDNDKIMTVGLAGAGLHAAAMCLAKRMDTDGILSVTLLSRHGATPDLIELLVAEGLFDHIDDRRIAVHGWLDRNPAVSDYSAAGREGNHRRWKHRGPLEACTRCNPEISPVAPDSPGDRPRVAATEGDLSTETTPEPPQPVDNQANGATPRSVAIPSPPDPPPTRTRVASRRPRIPESESETESETELEKPPFRARTPVENLTPTELAARKELEHITALHHEHHPTPELP